MGNEMKNSVYTSLLPSGCSIFKVGTSHIWGHAALQLLFQLWNVNRNHSKGQDGL